MGGKTVRMTEILVNSMNLDGNNFIIQNMFCVNRLGILTSLPLHSSFHICGGTKHRLISFQPTFDSPLTTTMFGNGMVLYFSSFFLQ